MKKILLFLFILCAFTAAKAQKVRNAKAGQKYKYETKNRAAYHFTAELCDPTNDGMMAAIMVKGYVGNEESSYFERKFDLADCVNPNSEGTKSAEWVNDRADINFDGMPDLQIYLWFTAVGQIIETYAAFVWNSEGYFEEVKDFKELCNPEIHPDSKTITSSYRHGINKLITDTYIWDGNNLKLIKQESVNPFEDENN